MIAKRMVVLLEVLIMSLLSVTGCLGTSNGLNLRYEQGNAAVTTRRGLSHVPAW